jgi:hypothetical protein
MPKKSFVSFEKSFECPLWLNIKYLTTKDNKVLSKAHKVKKV